MEREGARSLYPSMQLHVLHLSIDPFDVSIWLASVVPLPDHFAIVSQVPACFGILVRFGNAERMVYVLLLAWLLAMSTASCQFWDCWMHRSWRRLMLFVPVGYNQRFTMYRIFEFMDLNFCWSTPLIVSVSGHSEWVWFGWSLKRAHIFTLFYWRSRKSLLHAVHCTNSAGESNITVFFVWLKHQQLTKTLQKL